MLAEQQHQADKATRACAVANKARQEVKGAKCAQRAWVLPPSKSSQALGGTDLASVNTMTSSTNSPMAEPSPATQPPQDEVSVYTVASKTDSSKPTSATMTPTAGGTRSYLAAVAPMTGLCGPAPAFTPVGATRGDECTRSGADGRAQNAQAVSQGLVLPSGWPLALAREDDTPGTTATDALDTQPVSPSGGALASLVSTSERTWTLSNEFQAMALLVSGSPPTPSTPAIVRELLNAIGALSAHNSPGTEDTESVGVWSDNTPIATAVHAGGKGDALGSNKDLAESEFAGEQWLEVLARHLDMRLQASERRTRSAVDTLLQNWEQQDTADQRHFWMDANLFIVELKRKVARASTLLQQLTTQAEEQKCLMDGTLANLAHRVDKKLKEVEVAITSMTRSISSMEDTIASATLALPMISNIKGWVTDAVATVWLAAGAPAAPPYNPPGASMPLPCSPTAHSLAAMESNLAADRRAGDAWAHAPRDPNQVINTGSYSPAGGARSDEMQMHETEPDGWDRFL
jgi:hypothetical protein